MSSPVGIWLWPLVAGVLVIGCTSRPAPIAGGAGVDNAIRSVLEAQQAAWNRGDIAAFMDGYARDETTTFVSGDSVTRGWQTVLDNYTRRYPTRDHMGVLTFSELEVHSVAVDVALVDGRWHLQRTGDAPHGRFSLVFRQLPSGWRIVHDTTTSATP